MVNSVRFLIVDDHPLVRLGVKRLLAQEFSTATIDDVGDSVEAKRALASQTYDLAVLDVELPGEDGISFLQFLRSSYPNVRVLIVSGYPESLFAVRALRAGAAGCLSKNDPNSIQLLCNAVKTVLSGGKFIGPVTADLLVSQLDRDTSRPLHETLSNREYDILVRIGAGSQIGRIAEDLHISAKTVSTYRARLLLKLQVNNTAELIEYAIRNQLTPKACRPAS
jgi:two-component system, NarL family, invasion response regulator UvrY